MSKQTILVIEDEIDILEVLIYNLEADGFRCYKALDGEAGLALAREKNPDLVLLDLMLPGLSGTEVCRRLKQDALTRDIPVIMVTAKGEETDAVLGLGLGADDYITKPFRPRELMARVAAVIRRTGTKVKTAGEERVEVNGVLIDPIRHEVFVEDHDVVLTATEFKILQLLASQPGRVFTREQITTKVLGQPMHPTDRNIDVHIKSIRKKLEDRRDVIETVRGVGYRFSDRSPRT